MYHHDLQVKALNKFDLSCKEVFISFLEQHNFTKIKIFNEVKIGFREIFDITARRNRTCNFEVGVKQDWGTFWKEHHDDVRYNWENKSAPFPHPHIHELYRKGNSKDNARLRVTHNVIMGGDFKRLVIIPRKTVLASEVIKKECRNIPIGEFDTFFSIPVIDSKLYWSELHEKWVHIPLKEVKEPDFSYLEN